MKEIYIKGVIGWDVTEDSVREQIKNDSSEKLRVIINSPGGSVFEAFAIHNLLKQYRGEVEGVIAPIAFSAASYILMACDKVIAFKNSSFMAHPSWNMEIGDAKAMQRSASILADLDKVALESYNTKIKLDKNELKDMIDNELWLIGWEKLTEFGIIDDVIDKENETGDEENILKIAFRESQTQSTNIETARQSVIDACKIAAFGNKDFFAKHNKPTEQQLKATPETQTAINPETPVENIKQEDNMTLQELLASNPDAKAEYDIVLESAKAEGRKEASMNAAEILKYEDVVLSQSAAKALGDGTPVEKYAMQKLAEEKAKREQTAQASANPFQTLTAKQTPAAQAPAVAEENTSDEPISPEEIQAKAKATANAFFGGK
jgi:ATP-dependent protease ClpP protease subunit